MQVSGLRPRDSTDGTCGGFQMLHVNLLTLQGVWCFRFHDVADAQHLQRHLDGVSSKIAAASAVAREACLREIQNVPRSLPQQVPTWHRNLPTYPPEQGSAFVSKHGPQAQEDRWLLGTNQFMQQEDGSPRSISSVGARTIKSALYRALLDPEFSGMPVMIGSCCKQQKCCLRWAVRECSCVFLSCTGMPALAAVPAWH
jgi:hypothetical protein